LIELSLFFSSFLAATILPFSSEAALYAALEMGLSKQSGVLIASLGNVSAIIVNYYLGYFLYEKMKLKLQNSKAYRLTKRYGVWSLFFSFLPIIGDPITIIAGIFRINFLLFIFIAGMLRVVRYIIIAYGLSF